MLRVHAAQEMMNYNAHSAHTVKTSITCLRKMKISKTMSGAPCCDKLRWEDPLRERGWGQLEQHLETKLTQKQNQQTKTRKTHFLVPLHSLHRKEIRKWKETHSEGRWRTRQGRSMKQEPRRLAFKPPGQAQRRSVS